MFRHFSKTFFHQKSDLVVNLKILLMHTNMFLFILKIQKLIRNVVGKKMLLS